MKASGTPGRATDLATEAHGTLAHSKPIPDALSGPSPESAAGAPSARPLLQSVAAADSPGLAFDHSRGDLDGARADDPLPRVHRPGSGAQSSNEKGAPTANLSLSPSLSPSLTLIYIG